MRCWRSYIALPPTLYDDTRIIRRFSVVLAWYSEEKMNKLKLLASIIMCCSYSFVIISYTIGKGEYIIPIRLLTKLFYGKKSIDRKLWFIIMLQEVRGMKDLLNEDYLTHEHIINVAKNISKIYCFAGIATPILEHTEVFSRTLGDTSDVVNKEMYTFLDRGGDSVTLRPEFTASIIRSFISHKMQHSLPLKLFSYGPIFRYDRPQAGRQRQFHQLNYEYLGIRDPYIDAELVKIAIDLLHALGILEDTALYINSLGSTDGRKNYVQKLIEYFTKYENDLSELSKARLAKNPMRIFDSKEKVDNEICLGAPLISEHYDEQDRKYFEDTLKYLDIFGVKYVINPKLVRGLDYYCHTAFEFVADKLGAQSTVLAGGRYDGLSETMGGPHVPAIGFASGIERIALLFDKSRLSSDRTTAVIPIGDIALNYCINVANILRQNNINVGLLKDGKIGKRMEIANKMNAKFAIIVGDNEISLGVLNVKNMDLGSEEQIKFDDLIKKVTHN